MRAKIALIVALASFLAAAALGAGMAGADPLAESAADRTVRGDDHRPRSLRSRRPACANGIDDDGDGLVDLADPDCTSPTGTSEATGPAPGGASSASPVPVARTGSGREPAESRRRSRRAAPSTATPAAAKEARRRHPQRKPRRRQRRRQVRRRRSAPRAPPAAATQPLAEGGDGGSPFDAGGAPTLANPTTTIAPFGPAPIGVPNFVIDSFEIPPFLLPIYQACGTEYGIPWEVLASINKIETGFGTNLNVSSAGAVGWMQFLPSSWETYGLDANGDGRKDPYNPVDAICAAAHYLKVAGGTKDLYDAILAYNHADWYAQEVLLYARAYGKLPADLVGSLTGLTEGAHFPVAADARYADDISARAALKNSTTDSRVAGNAAEVISSSPTRRGINIFAQPGRAGRRRQRRRDPQDRQLRRSSASSSSSKTPTATATPTPSSASSSATTARWSPPTGKEQQIPVESQDLRPRLRALPDRAAGDAEPENRRWLRRERRLTEQRRTRLRPTARCGSARR